MFWRAFALGTWLKPALKPTRPKCWPKIGHDEQGDAETQLHDILHNGMEKDATRIHTYLCPFCGRWHVGHSGGK